MASDLLALPGDALKDSLLNAPVRWRFSSFK
jgi:hypothetical protein